MLRWDSRDLEKKLSEFPRLLKQKLMEAAAEGMDLIGTLAQGRYWIVPGGEDKPTHPSKLTVRSGRLIRSLSPQGGAFSASGEREQIREVRVSGGKVIGIFGTRVPYAAIHEHGGTIPAMTIYPKRASVLHFFTSSGEEVFARYANVPARTIPPRPYLSPAARDAESKIVGIIEGKIAEIAI